MRKVLLYTNRQHEIDQYATLIREARLAVDLTVCRTEQDIDACIEDAEIVFGVHLPPAVYEKAKSLKWIQSMWAGVEYLLVSPVPPGVLITKPVGVFGQFLSNYVFGNLLAQKIKYKQALEAQEKHQWTNYAVESLAGQTMCIAGMGDIGAEIAKVAKAFDMKVWCLNRDGRPHELADRSFSTDERVEFVSGADALVLILPSTPATRHLFNRELLSHLPKHSWIINVGRGSLIEDDALIELLRAEKIAGAILDVFHQEPLPPDNPYWGLPNCVVTPHVGGPSVPSQIASCFVENFKRYESGKPLLGLVDRTRGY